MFATEYLRTPLGRTKALSVALGLGLIGIGFFSHFGSDWVKDPEHDSSSQEAEPIYSQCRTGGRNNYGGVIHGERRGPTRRGNGTCPHIAMEYFFLAAIVTSFIFTTVNLILCISTKSLYESMKACDTRFYVGMGLVLLIASALFIVSADLVRNAVGNDEEASEAYKVNVKLRTVEKIIAGVVGILQGLVFVVIALLHRRASN